MDEEHHYDLFRTWEEEKTSAILRLCIGDARQEAAEIVLGEAEKVTFEIVSDNESYRFYVVNGKEHHYLGKASAKHLSSEAAGGFTGVVMGLYAVDSRGQWAAFTKLQWIQQQNDRQETER